MPKPSQRSRSERRVRVKLPGGRTKTDYRKRKPKAAHCAGCGAALAGVPRALPSKMKNMPKTKKRPERPFGGMLCTRCSRQRLREKAMSG